MIHYHGGPITPRKAAREIYRGIHALVSFANKRDIDLVAEVAQSFIIDNGAYSLWTQARRTGRTVRSRPDDWRDYERFCWRWTRHPACDWYLLPDQIEGTEEDNDRLLRYWDGPRGGVPVWHMDESLNRLERLADTYPRIAIGACGPYAAVGSKVWDVRMRAAMTLLCTYPEFYPDEDADQAWFEDRYGPADQPRVKVHGLRMLNSRVYGRYPLASADSSFVARTIGFDHAWKWNVFGDRADRGRSLTARIDVKQSAGRLVPAESR